MLRLLSLLLFVTLLLNAAEKVEIYASNMDSKGETVIASGGVTVLYQDYLLTADKAIYNRASGDLELFENIRVNYNGNYKILGKYAKLNIKKKEKLFQPFFMTDKESKVWISADKAEAKDKDIDITAGMTSGCNPTDPDWSLEFSGSDYNSDTMWLNLYNTRFYLGDLPVFYLPYFGYSLDTTRRTGLLMPSLGLSGDEGFFYEQPIYIAEQSWWDLELKPQIRTSRGSGLYETFRFLDSKTSGGEFTAGYFKEQEHYYKEKNLQNRSHYGFDFKYQNTNFVEQWFGFDLQGDSVIYVDAKHMNDVDYINLASSDKLNNSTAQQLLSRVNMFYNTDENYVAAYFKYYQDLTLESNAATLQKLPTLQYHNYINTLLDDHLLYSIDVQSTNIEREEGKTALQTDINIPITLQTSLFDEYLNISYRSDFYLQQSSFGGSDLNTAKIYNDGYFLRNNHTLSASTQLTRAYENLSHVISFGVTHNFLGQESRHGYYDDNKDFCSKDINKNDSRCEFYNLTDVQDETKLEFIQYLFDSYGDEFIYHRVAQTISRSSVNSDKLGDLENELDYKVTSYLSYYNNMFYNYEHENFSKVFNSLTLSGYGVSLGLSHLYRNSYIRPVVAVGAVGYTPQHTDYLTTSIGYTYNKHYSYSAAYNYDREAGEIKSMDIGFMYKQRCWDFGLKYSENNRPVLIQENGVSKASSVYDRYIFLTLVLKPFMQANGSSFLNFKLSEE